MESLKAYLMRLRKKLRALKQRSRNELNKGLKEKLHKDAESFEEL